MTFREAMKRVLYYKIARGLWKLIFFLVILVIIILFIVVGNS